MGCGKRRMEEESVGGAHICLYAVCTRGERCLSHPSSTPNAPSAASPCTPLKRCWRPEKNGTKPASSAVCATSGWTAPTPPSTRRSCSASSATAGSSDPRDTGSEAELGASLWTPEHSSATQNAPCPTSPLWTQPMVKLSTVYLFCIGLNRVICS
ncbi:hypothetical protein JTE90_029372 [Oedothorax gibbosus]|uniref:Uncharacterized protein n=1 Tax=Oedothorax gibbosus TaxID=931172 RepID=A0AAV6VMR8_9ARAC|nr:hypothetical protein JTE90_029372 [Oedothorax gibbosus]